MAEREELAKDRKELIIELVNLYYDTETLEAGADDTVRFGRIATEILAREARIVAECAEIAENYKLKGNVYTVQFICKRISEAIRRKGGGS